MIMRWFYPVWGRYGDDDEGGNGEASILRQCGIHAIFLGGMGCLRYGWTGEVVSGFGGESQEYTRAAGGTGMVANEEVYGASWHICVSAAQQLHSGVGLTWEAEPRDDIAKRRAGRLSMPFRDIRSLTTIISPCLRSRPFTPPSQKQLNPRCCERRPGQESAPTTIISPGGYIRDWICWTGVYDHGVRKASSSSTPSSPSSMSGFLGYKSQVATTPASSCSQPSPQ